MTAEKKSVWRTTSAAAIVVAVGVALCIAARGSTTSPGSQLKVTGPLVARGYTEAPTGTVVLASDPAAGDLLLELRVKDGQKVKRDQIIAVMRNYPQADVGVRNAESNLEREKIRREAMLSGYRRTMIAMQESAVRLTLEQSKLKALELARSGEPPKMKQLELSISHQSFEREQAKLRIMKETLKTDLAISDANIEIALAALDDTRISREQALVRSPIDGVIVNIYCRPGERQSDKGIVKIVDLGDLHVFAEIDDVHLGRVAPGVKVEVSFVGSRLIYRGRVFRVAQMVKQVQQTDDHGSVAVHSIQVEIEFDDPSSIPQLLGREAHVTFL